MYFFYTFIRKYYKYIIFFNMYNLLDNKHSFCYQGEYKRYET